MTGNANFDAIEADNALLDLEGTLHALELVRMGDDLNKPGPAFHALATLARLAVQQVAQVRRIVLEEASGEAGQ